MGRASRCLFRLLGGHKEGLCYIRVLLVGLMALWGFALPFLWRFCSTVLAGQFVAVRFANVRQKSMHSSEISPRLATDPTQLPGSPFLDRFRLVVYPGVGLL